MRLTAYPDLSAADWIAGSDLPWDQLARFGPAGFAAYARLRFLPDPAYERQRESDVDVQDGAPSQSTLLADALQVLGGHTRTPDDCYFCLWDGWESDAPTDDTEWISDFDSDAIRREGDTARPGIAPTSGSIDRGPKVVIPNRAYFLFRGALSGLSDPGTAAVPPGRPWPDTADPAFIWPADHAWCVAVDVDPHYAGIGADASAIDDLVADPRLDVVPADPRLRQPSYR